MVCWAALLPLTLKVGAETPLGSDVVDQVYSQAVWPAASLPRTENRAAVPVTALDDAAAAVATVGATTGGATTVAWDERTPGSIGSRASLAKRLAALNRVARFEHFRT